MSGFAVFSVVGYLQHIKAQEDGTGGGTGLAFVAFPAAITKMGVPNLWAVILFITLFTLGVDSAFSMVEAASTVIADTGVGKKVNRMLIALSICLLGLCCSIVFCSNFGQEALDVVDFYLTAYLMVLLGILQCSSVGWVFQVSEKISTKPELKTSFMILTIGYWVPLLVFGILAFVAFYDVNYVGAILFIVSWAASTVVAWKKSGLSWNDFYHEVFMNGVEQMAKAMTRLSYPGHPEKRVSWMPVFEFYWGFCTKYLIPAGLWWMLLMSIRTRIVEVTNGDSSLHETWHYVGMIFPIAGFLLFLGPIFRPMGTEEDIREAQEAVDKMVYGKEGKSAVNPSINDDGPKDADNKVSPQ